MEKEEEEEEGEEENPDGLSINKKRKRSSRNNGNYHRHSTDQIKEMEELFKVCQHPDERLRRELGEKLGLKQLQVKFWFQNKRTQMKNLQERTENQELRGENERLQIENSRYKEALRGVVCPNCGDSQALLADLSIKQQLLMENDKLKQEIIRVATVAEKYNGKMISSPCMSLGQQEAGKSCIQMAGGSGEVACDERGASGSGDCTGFSVGGNGYNDWPGSSAFGFGGWNVDGNH